jgi:hypothetical protein
VKELLLPRSDTTVIVQALVVFPPLVATLVLVRRDREWRTFILGVLAVTLGLFGLRAVH